MNITFAAAATGVGCRPPFTASQWEELKHQALIYKYLIAGIPVPPELFLPIRRSYETMVTRFYSYPDLGYCSYYGKKLDQEPGRCRRTDGKKWRCSKDAYPDSKYCERHMHRRLNRSRKHVETPQTLFSQLQSSSSAATSPSPFTGSPGTCTAAPSASGASGGSFHAFPFQSIASVLPLPSDLGNAASSFVAKDFRNLHGSKSVLDDLSIYSEASPNLRGLGVDSSLDSPWNLMPSPTSASRMSKDIDSSLLHCSFSQLQSPDDPGQVTISSLPKQQHSIFQCEFNSSESSIKTEHSIRPFSDEWPRTRDLWSDVEHERSNCSVFSSTQLSMMSCRTRDDD